jgi:outer membrane immunogenic protein
VRGRLGFLITPNWLVYGTGGFAYGRVEQTWTLTNTANGISVLVLTPPSFSCPAASVCAAGSNSEIQTGWTAGGGFEYLLPNIRILNSATTVKLEYLYVNLGSQNVIVPTLTNPAASFTASSDDIAFHVVRAGVNVKF